MIIPRGYKLAIITPDGQTAKTIDLQGYDLSRTIARNEVALEITNSVERIVRSEENK